MDFCCPLKIVTASQKLLLSTRNIPLYFEKQTKFSLAKSPVLYLVSVRARACEKKYTETPLTGPLYEPASYVTGTLLSNEPLVVSPQISNGDAK